ncbi:preQ(1) synthase [Myxococcota bacterium]|nr:preQ(1) synthase [Myxococcota bacterium]MBU1381763.1 preQ(1) synthase [Myxococcota bacterium]MBU1496398.1 preQ(1) synthase [Myxococcota bacterium]
MSTKPSKDFETFPNPRPGREYLISIDTDEFTALCPVTGQPDFAKIFIDYIPEKLCVELKSLKLYLWSYRNEGAFHEDVTNRICDDLVSALEPLYIKVRGDFNIRGGVRTVVTVERDLRKKA